MMKQQQQQQQEQVADKSNYPRTGKRGVPQQFPRKLFEMLDMESNRIRSGCVAWSSCGRAFRIADVAVFSEEILPAYFKTSKFSSFQRNLNLYGFAKINKGVYAHPQFRRGDKDGLTQLRKRVKASRSSNKITPPSSPTSSSRMVSPPMSPTHEMMDNQHPLHHHQQQHQHHDASSERLLILAQAVRVAMVLEAGSNVCKESNFSSVYC
eukprot:CAMPEP_0113388246 /NCGR_PEP_ID=MMETSP0013_2-20120614/8980_1 /TAXON_ID=2843 ORGANISM="Skeletonema costatum, Strain 1716" /NCGR_SAMPLE_ID=MMETSP0013_2 /ASSEMBLY_ACC=CAM_ASM_000158 /LENGTH=208 /DNA_ID=CAMNT_0000271221 /DNA_START=39 /DNA_END=665 /DNA_ORIENTATION=+ /assembly_acc=CAM_ASM_000158